MLYSVYFDQQEKVMHSSSFWKLQVPCKKIKGREAQLIIDLTRMILMVWSSRRTELFEYSCILNNYLYSDIKSGWNCNQKYKICIAEIFVFICKQFLKKEDL